MIEGRSANRFKWNVREVEPIGRAAKGARHRGLAAKVFTGLALDGPDPECSSGHGERARDGAAALNLPTPGPTHSVPVRLGRR